MSLTTQLPSEFDINKSEVQRIIDRNVYLYRNYCSASLLRPEETQNSFLSRRLDNNIKYFSILYLTSSFITILISLIDISY